MTLFAVLAVRAAVILCATFLAALALRRATAAARHRVWTLGVIGVLALPLASVALPEWQVLPSVEAKFPVAIGTAFRTRTTAAPAPRSVAPENKVPTPAATSPRDTARLAIAMWALVSCVLVAHIAIGIARVRRLARRARPGDRRWNDLLAATEVNVHGRRVRLLVSDDIAMPMTWGSRPALLIVPAEALAWSDERARVVLLHEIAHVLRADWLTHALARLVAAVHWFNPLAWMALHAMTRERERACDDYVLLHGTRASDYAAHLLDIARAGQTGLRHAIAPAMARRSELEGRLLAILTPHRLQPGPLAGPLMTVIAVATTTVIAAATPMTDTASHFDSVPDLPIVSRTSPIGARAVLMGTSDDGSAGRESVKALVQGLEDPSSDIREDAALGLAMTEDRSAIQPLIEALNDPDEQVREKAALGLSFRSESSVIDPLLAALGDPSAQVREKAAIGLGMRRLPRVTDALIAAASDSDSQVREKVIVALGLTGDPRATSVIVAATKDPDAQVREKAVTAVGMLKSGSPQIQEAIRAGVAGALRLLGGRINPEE
jgi:beta-lactamase regulating signal transducer with metallopeptidase domain